MRLWFVILSLCFIGCSKEVELKDESSKTLYALGTNLGKNLVQLELSEEDLKYVHAGLKDEVLGNESRVSFEEYQVKINELFQSRIASQAKSQKEMGTRFIENFMGENPSAKRMDNGLVLLTEKKGEGPIPKLTDTILIRYTGKLIDGEVFDSTDDRSDPAELPLTRVIKGWQIGLQKLNVGSKATLVIPPELAYGDAGAPPSVAPGATLVFDVELVGIVGFEEQDSSAKSEGRTTESGELPEKEL